MINYKLLDDSLNFYESKGFNRIETPWTVSEYVDNITKPPDRQAFQLKHNDKCLVASGEQSFLYLALKEYLPKGKYQTITPCFRFESFDFLHTKYFMKNELIVTDEVNKFELNRVLSIALEFYGQFFDKNDLKITLTDDGYDINLKEIELGSYGIRKCDFLKWVYGTGCAEPRLSKLIDLYGVPQ